MSHEAETRPVAKLIDIASRAKQYDPEAFAEIFDLFFEKIRRYMYFHTGDIDMAEDLAAEVFTLALECIKNFDDRGGSIGSWLYGIARNTLAGHYRSIGKSSIVPLDSEFPAPETEKPEETVLSELTYADLYRAMALLPPEQKEVVILRFIEGYRVKTVAKMMNKSPGAVRALQHRALVSLRKTFKPEEH